jgi:hypothetical protein
VEGLSKIGRKRSNDVDRFAGSRMPKGNRVGMKQVTLRVEGRNELLTILDISEDRMA